MSDLKIKLRELDRESRIRTASLKDSLHRLYSREARVKSFPDDSLTREHRGMHEFVDGEYVNTSWGDVFIGKVRYPKDHLHGSVELRSMLAVSDDWLSRWGHFSYPRKFDCRRTIFVDTETSGLAGAGGTIAFLIGIGYFYRSQFRVEQFFADSYAREEGMLDLVVDFVEPFDTLVTFNGKSFDMPLLEARYLLKRKGSPFARMDHLDLLHPSRQLWNLTLDDCRLQTIEEKILRFTRKSDLGGDEIPAAYFKFVRSGNPDPLYRVFEHNAHDIASLVATAYVLWKQTQEQACHGDAGLEFSRGKIFRRHGQIYRAIRSLKAARRRESSYRRRAAITAQLSMLYKSLGKWQEAEALWLEMVEDTAPFFLLPYVELAKYYEHRTKDVQKAQMLVNEAIARIAPHRTRELGELNYRLARLKRKIARAEKSRI